MCPSLCIILEDFIEFASIDEGSSDLVTSPSFIPGACKLAEAREVQGGAAVSDCRDIRYDSQQPVVISAVQEVEVGHIIFQLCVILSSALGKGL